MAESGAGKTLGELTDLRAGVDGEDEEALDEAEALLGGEERGREDTELVGDAGEDVLGEDGDVRVALQEGKEELSSRLTARDEDRHGNEGVEAREEEREAAKRVGGVLVLLGERRENRSKVRSRGRGTRGSLHAEEIGDTSVGDGGLLEVRRLRGRVAADKGQGTLVGVLWGRAQAPVVVLHIPAEKRR